MKSILPVLRKGEGWLYPGGGWERLTDRRDKREHETAFEETTTQTYEEKLSSIFHHFSLSFLVLSCHIICI